MRLVRKANVRSARQFLPRGRKLRCEHKSWSKLFGIFTDMILLQYGLRSLNRVFLKRGGLVGDAGSVLEPHLQSWNAATRNCQIFVPHLYVMEQGSECFMPLALLEETRLSWFDISKVVICKVCIYRWTAMLKGLLCATVTVVRHQ